MNLLPSSPTLFLFSSFCTFQSNIPLTFYYNRSSHSTLLPPLLLIHIFVCNHTHARALFLPSSMQEHRFLLFSRRIFTSFASYSSVVVVVVVGEKHSQKSIQQSRRRPSPHTHPSSSLSQTNRHAQTLSSDVVVVVVVLVVVVVSSSFSTTYLDSSGLRTHRRLFTLVAHSGTGDDRRDSTRESKQPTLNRAPQNFHFCTDDTTVETRALVAPATTSTHANCQNLKN